jgi:hypothetical protein
MYAVHEIQKWNDFWYACTDLKGTDKNIDWKKTYNNKKSLKNIYNESDRYFLPVVRKSSQ